MDVGEVLAIYVLQKLADPEVERIIEAVKGWRPFLRDRGVRHASILIYGPRGEVLARVEVEDQD